MFTYKQNTNHSQTVHKRISLLILLFLTIVIATPNLKAQYEALYLITTPSPCIGNCPLVPPNEWHDNNDIIITVINDQGVPCTFHARFAWRHCAGKLYLQNQEIYSELPAGCMIGVLRHTTQIIDAVYKTALENLISTQIATSSDTATCYLPGSCVRMCAYDDLQKGVCRGFPTACSSDPNTNCCFTKFVYSNTDNQAHKISVVMGTCLQNLNGCAQTYLYDGRLLNLPLIPYDSNCEPQCGAN